MLQQPKGRNMKYIIRKDGAKEHILQIQNQLMSIEVKGDSVEHLYIARKMLKDLFDSLEEYKEEEKKEG
jgi:hypothetical protein